MANIKDRAIDAGAKAQRCFSLDDTVGMVINNIALQLNGESMYIPCWSGTPGIGKTTYAKMIAEKLNLDMFYVSMNKSVEYYMGLPITNKLSFETEENKNNMYVYWSEPEMVHEANLRARNKAYRGCLVFMDDIHIMSPDVQKCFFELVLERKLGNYHFDDNVAFLAAMNSSSIAGFDGFLSAINNRLQRINVNLPFATWYQNCGADLNPYIAGYVRHYKESLIEEESIDEPFATYRSWTTLSKLLEPIISLYNQKKDKNWFLNQIRMNASGFMSQKMVSGLIEDIGFQLKFDFESMVKNNKYYIDKSDPVAQFCFGNIIRYINKKEEVDQLVAFLMNELKIAGSNLNDIRNVLLNVIFELLTFRKSLEFKTDNESISRLQNVKYLQDQLFRQGGNVVHQIIKDIMSNAD